MATNPENVENRNFQPVVLAGGLDLVTSKFTVYPGSLQDCLNYESSDTGYTRSQGLLFFDGTYDSAVEDMWYIGAQLNPRVDATMANPTLDFTVGGEVSWNGSTGTVAYWNSAFGATDYVELGIVDVEHGAAPAAGDTIVDATTGAALTLDSGMAYPPVTLVGAVHPSTGVQLANTIDKYLAYINGTVNTQVAGQEYVPGSLSFHGKLPGVGATTGGFQYKNTVYGVRDYYAVGFYQGDTIVPNDSDVVVITSAGRYRGTVAEARLVSGYWEANNAKGSLMFKPPLALAADWLSGTTYYINDTATYNDIEYICLVSHVAAGGNEPDGSTDWQINDVKLLENIATLDQIVDVVNNSQVALVDTAKTVYKGALWKATNSGWMAVDTGYSLDYDTGTTVPVVATTPMFLVDLVADSRIHTTGQTIVDHFGEAGNSPLVTWTLASNIKANDGAYATAILAPGATTTYLSGRIPASAVPDDTVQVVGIEINVEAKYTTTGVPIDIDVHLHDNATGTTQYLSANRTKQEVLTGTDAVYTYGSSTDTWGFSAGLDPAQILSGDMYVRIQYTNPDTVSATVAVDYISAAIHYVPIKQKAYVYNGVTDSAEVDITAFQIISGDFDAGNDAAGHMTLYNVTDSQAIKNGMPMYSGPLGTGDFIATIRSEPVYNLLPSHVEMDAAGSKYESVVANFRQAADAQGAYVATGASPAFMFEDGYFSWIRTPQWIVKDKPRHLAYHANMLALGFDGSVIVSALGVPNDFSGGSGAQFPTGGKVVGLASLPGEGVLGVWTERRMMTLTGLVPTALSLGVVSDSSGGREYTVQDIGTPYFADFRGLGTVETTDRFGDFLLGRISYKITPYLKDRLQERRSIDSVPQKPIAAITVRNKNQYRLYFEDGYILTMTFFDARPPEFTLQHYDTVGFGTDYVPTFVNSYVMSNGRERNIMGTADGSMWIIDGANGIQDSTGLTTMDAYITLNPTNLKRPEGVNKIYHTVIQGQFFGHCQISAWSDSNYIFDQSGAAEDTINIGSSSNEPVFTSVNNLDSVYASRIADGYSLKLKTSIDGSKPHTLQSLLFRASAKGTDRNRTERSY